MVREALAALLGLETDIEVVAQVARGDEVLAAARAHEVDVALLDIEMPGMTGIEAAAELRAALPDVKVVVLTTFGRPGYLRRAMESGAAAFLVKDAPAAQLAEAVRKVLDGERVIDPTLAAAALANGANPLTDREREILRAAADGSTNAELAGALHLSAGHGPQLPVDGDPETGGPQPGGGGPDGAGEGLAVGPAGTRGGGGTDTRDGPQPGTAGGGTGGAGGDVSGRRA